jgi:UDP-glucose 4-epimerase
MRLLVIGHGMLGRAVLRHSAEGTSGPAMSINWQEPTQARTQLVELAESFGRSIEGVWRLAWCAGTGVVGTSVDHFADEHSYLETFLTSLATAVPRALAPAGGVFFASSAGGAFGQGSSERLTEDSRESAISSYGQSKLAQEREVAQWSDDSSIPVLIGRLSNLYGPGQNLAKPQGFISQLLRSMLLRRPFRLGVSGDTERDFIHVDDAAAKINAWFVSPGESRVTRKLIAAGQSHTLATVANMVHSVTRIQPKIMYAATVGSELQPRHLRFVSRVRTDIDAAAPCRPLEIGISETWHAMLRGFGAGSFAEPASGTLKLYGH